MKLIRFFVAILVLGGFWLSAANGSQDARQNESGPASLTEYDVVCRGKLSQARGVNPADIVRMDTNGEILLACLEPKTVEQLRAEGVEFVRSQLELLTDWNFLKYDRAKNTYSTTIHIYGPQKASAIRDLVGAGVSKLAADLDADLAAPLDFENPANNQPADVGHLAFIIKPGKATD